jgi:pre-rRNA-processing protein TSR4
MQMAFLDVDQKKLTEEEVHKNRATMVPEHPSNKTLKCKSCNKRLFLIVQAYAPLGSNDRFLYVFGCNNSHCSAKQNSWVAFRCQFEVDESKGLVTNFTQEEETVEVEEKQPEFEVKLIEEESEEEVEEEEKEEPVEDLDAKLDSLLKLQEEQLNQPKKKKNKKKNKKSKKTISKLTRIEASVTAKAQKISTKNTFPCFELDIFEEPEDDLSDILTKEQSHEFKLYTDYQKKQEQLEQTDNDAEQPTQEDFDDDEMEEFSNQMLDQNIGKGIGLGDGEHFEETRVKDVTQALLRFESIIARCPSQSVRWQFGGQPLWSSTRPENLPPKWPQKRKQNDPNSKLQVVSRDDDSDDEDEDDGSKKVDVSQYIPKCEHCGAARVFELELLPTLVYQLSASNYVVDDGSKNEGMDFGCVTIFTCLNQCTGLLDDDHKLKYMREYVHVQPPL